MCERNYAEANRLDRIRDKMQRVLRGPDTSYWFRDALEKALKRDPVDVARDATYLATLLNERCDAILGIPPRGRKGE